LKLLDHGSEIPWYGPRVLIHAVMNVILDQLFLGVADSSLDGVQLLRQIHARPACLHHVDDTGKMTLCALQPSSYFREPVHGLSSFI
jgi:hypothetical protein